MDENMFDEKDTLNNGTTDAEEIKDKAEEVCQPPHSSGNSTFSGNNTTTETSGEYRYKPPYASYGANTPGVGYSTPRVEYNTESHEKNDTIKNKKADNKNYKERRFSTAAVALLVVACIVISFGAGFGGAYLYGIVFGDENITEQSSSKTNTAVSDDGSMVIYKSVTVADNDNNEITDSLTVTQVAEVVADSVVEITTEYTSSYGFYQYVTSGAGSGVIITENGYIVTNNHVIVDDSGDVADLITVRLKNGEEYKAECIGTDSESDIAVLKVEAEGLAFAVIGDSSKLNVGDEVVAVGNPLGELGGTVTDGIISATSREIDVDGTKMTLLQTNAAINPGNSGGGLFNMRGELIGIVNAKSSGTGIEGLGFAIPVNDALTVVEEIKTHGYVTGRTFIGVQFVEITDPFEAYRYFNSKSTGVYVYATSEGYNDDALEFGDRVIAINGEEVSTYEDIKSVVKSAEVGDILTFSVYRNGKLKDIEVECFEYVPDSVEFSEE